MSDDKVKQLIPNTNDGVLKNLADIAEEHRKGNIQCLMLCFRRKNGEGTRTFFIGADDPYMFCTLERLKHDILGIFSDDITNAIEYLDGDDEG